MNDAKYIGMDVHQATISAAVRDSSESLVIEATLETKAATAEIQGAVNQIVHREENDIESKLTN